MSEDYESVNNSEVLNIIPKLYRTIHDIDRQKQEAIIDYWRNPCVVEIRFVYPSGKVSEHYTRAALDLQLSNGNVPYKGIDSDTLGFYLANDIEDGYSKFFAGKADLPNQAVGESIKYLGRLSDINESENPAKRSTIFEDQIEYYFPDRVE